MISSILIIAFSLVLMVYWFRYTCLLILRTRTSADYAAPVIAANNLRFPEVQERLAEESGLQDLGPLHESLRRDYRLLTYLLRHAAGFQLRGITVEQRMLMIDFKVMQVWYALTKKFGGAQAGKALEEMSHILNHFANAMGERAASASGI